MPQFRDTYLASVEAAKMLGITRLAVGRLIRQGKIPGEKIANRWLVPRAFVEEFAKTYVPRRGRLRQKRKYIKRSAVWKRR